jgi:uncharacterized oligopeptide transporter (OPT) family protein
MTSIIFGVPITFVSTVGICVSIGGFIAFTYYKLERKKKNSHNKVLMKSSGMSHGHGNSGSSSILPL